MKQSHVLILTGVVAAVMAIAWQARRIKELQTEVGSLREDLRLISQAGLDQPGGNPSEADGVRREKLELIKLRHQVRELKEGLSDSHARERMANVQTVLRTFVPTPTAVGTWRLRPEWKGMEAHATNSYAQAMKALAGATNDYVRFLSMHRAATMSLAVGRTEEARQLATDMMVLDDKHSRGDPEKAHGDVVHDGHRVLGHIALDEGRIEEAKRHLLAAGKSTGSPVLGSFGPNMSLAKELLEKGEQECVLQYFDLCRKFWRSDKLDEWAKDIQAGRIPAFGANLNY
jgi:hypothetical protein